MATPVESKAGLLPGSMGLKGVAGLQLKGKKFGLHRPRKLEAAATGFKVDDVEDLSVASEIKRLSSSKQAIAAADAAQKAVLSQDASAYDYDGVYDTMKEEKQKARAVAQPKERSTRYIGAIMEAHKGREIENEKVFERKMHKEAEEEAHLYGDKEKFLTNAYVKKLQAREEYEAEQKRKDEKDAREDVTQRGDMHHFYANLLDNKLAPDEQRDLKRDVAFAATKAGGGAAVDEGTSSDTPPATSGEGAAADEPPPVGPATSEATAEATAATKPEKPFAEVIASATAASQRMAKAAPPAVEEVAPVECFERRNDGTAVTSARERFLQRKKQKP